MVTPINLIGLLSSVYRGMTSASEIIAFVFVIGGVFGLVTKSGAINAALGKLIRKMEGRETLLISIVMTAFAICGATFGMAEETLPFVAVLVTVSLALGFVPPPHDVPLCWSTRTPGMPVGALRILRLAGERRMVESSKAVFPAPFASLR